MGKYDGMDPKLVRDLLTEVEHAATQLRTVEGQVRVAMGRAGLPSQATHRPAQVADAVDVMVRDVNVRLEELEKRADPPKGADEPKDERREGRRGADPGADDGASTGKDGTTGVEPPPKSDDEPKRDTDGKPDADGKPDVGDKPDVGGKPDADGKPDVGDKPDADGKPDVGEKPDADGKCDDSDGAKDTGTGKDAEGDGKTGDQPVDQPKDDEPDSRRDRGAEADGGVTDTPANDGEQGVGKPRVVVVDGVKVLQVPLDPPTAEQLEDMLENSDDVQPAEMPKLPADPAGVSNAGTWDDTPAADGKCDSGKDTTPGDQYPAPDRPTGDAPDQGRDDGQGTGDQGTGGQGRGDQGAGDRGGGDQGTGDQGTGDQGGDQGSGDQGTGKPVTIPPTDPSVELPDGDAARPNVGAEVGDAEVGDRAGESVESGYGVRVILGGGEGGFEVVAGSGVEAWAGDGSEVVSVGVLPPDLDALRTVIDHHRDVQPLDLPSVEVPPGAYGKGEWEPVEVRPDGPPGSVDPGAPERSP
ncbi:hypothetical protein [Nonomuraea sp. NPDC050643]|uniref:hypothetical protein n=1 Tax=Nonomuraea sp. NPDC050643 TaxID=3155660 RepID=UPI00340063D4